MDEGREAFQEILKLYNFTGSAYSEKQIDGIVGLKSARHFARLISENGVTFARGTRVEMEFDEDQFVGGGVFLFASVIEHFLGEYVSLEQLHAAYGAHAAEEGGPQGMATPGRTNNSALEAVPMMDGAEPGPYQAVDVLLHRTPQEFEFFQAVRLFERLFPERSPVGRFVSPSKEVLRFCAHASMPFPPSRIQRMDWPDEPGPAPRMVINFMGLAGPSGLLPLYYTELIVDRLRNKDHALREFLDIFNHRMISLFYQAWEKYRFAIPYERGERDRFSHSLMDLIGMGTTHLDNRLAVRDDTLMYYSGLLSLRSRSATALRAILWDYFDVPVEIEQFVGAWHRSGTFRICACSKHSPMA